MSKNRIPAVDGMFTMDFENPQLIGGRSKSTGSYYFPKDLSGSTLREEVARTVKKYFYQQLELSGVIQLRVTLLLCRIRSLNPLSLLSLALWNLRKKILLSVDK